MTMTFQKIEEVPAAIAEFYTTETRSEQQFNGDGTPVLEKVEYQTEDLEGNPVTAYRMVPVYADNTYVIQQQRLECRSFEDVWAVVHRHAGKRDDIVRKFLAMACRNNQWQFHDDYLAWFKEGQELDAIVLPEPVEGEPDPLIAHQEKIAEHEAQEPVKPALIDIDQWFLDNYSQLREAAYETPEHQDEMRFDDAVNGTTVWVDHIKSVKAQYPKPEAQA